MGNRRSLATSGRDLSRGLHPGIFSFQSKPHALAPRSRTGDVVQMMSKTVLIHQPPDPPAPTYSCKSHSGCFTDVVRGARCRR
jgi:hypothetical protein